MNAKRTHAGLLCLRELRTRITQLRWLGFRTIAFGQSDERALRRPWCPVPSAPSPAAHPGERVILGYTMSKPGLSEERKQSQAAPEEKTRTPNPQASRSPVQQPTRGTQPPRRPTNKTEGYCVAKPRPPAITTDGTHSSQWYDSAFPLSRARTRHGAKMRIYAPHKLLPSAAIVEERYPSQSAC